MLEAIVGHVQRFLAEEEGPTAVEYAVMMALVIVVCFVAVQSLGNNTNNTYNKVATKLSGS